MSTFGDQFKDHSQQENSRDLIFHKDIHLTLASNYMQSWSTKYIEVTGDYQIAKYVISDQIETLIWNTKMYFDFMLSGLEFQAEG